MIQFVERKRLFPEVSPNTRKHAPSLGAMKASLLKSGDSYQFHLAERIQEVYFISQHGSQSYQHRAWFIPPQGKMPTILVSGPNMGHLNHILDLLPFTLVGYGVITYEYPGYGKTVGKPTEASLYRSVEAASGYLSQQHHIPAQQQIGYGVSLGGAVTAHLSAQRPLKAVIMESSFTSIPDTAHLSAAKTYPPQHDWEPVVEKTPIPLRQHCQNGTNPMPPAHSPCKERSFIAGGLCALSLPKNIQHAKKS